jgi:hypothetical protein
MNDLRSFDKRPRIVAREWSWSTRRLKSSVLIIISDLALTSSRLVASLCKSVPLVVPGIDRDIPHSYLSTSFRYEASTTRHLGLL